MQSDARVTNFIAACLACKARRLQSVTDAKRLPASLMRKTHLGHFGSLDGLFGRFHHASNTLLMATLRIHQIADLCATQSKGSFERRYNGKTEPRPAPLSNGVPQHWFASRTCTTR